MAIKTDKVCEIINEHFTWILKVDGHTIPFHGFETAEYFEALYSKLGYKILKREI